MVDISNKTMALLLVAAMFVSLGGTMVTLNSIGSGITGYAPSDAGTANITIASDISIEFTTAQIDFGSGFTNDSGAGMEHCTFDTNGTDPAGDCVNFNSGLAPFVIENIGNQDAALALQFDDNAAGFIGGTTPGFEYFVQNGEAGSCTGTIAPTSFTTIDTSSNSACTVFEFEEANDELNVHINVSIPQDAPTATNTVTLTATAS